MNTNTKKNSPSLTNKADGHGQPEDRTLCFPAKEARPDSFRTMNRPTLKIYSCFTQKNREQ